MTFEFIISMCLILSVLTLLACLESLRDRIHILELKKTIRDMDMERVERGR